MNRNYASVGVADSVVLEVVQTIALMLVAGFRV